MGITKWSVVASRHHSLKFKTAPPSDNQAYYMASAADVCLAHLVKRYRRTDPNRTVRLDWALKTNSINQFFKILAPTPNCCNEKPASQRPVIWVRVGAFDINELASTPQAISLILTANNWQSVSDLVLYTQIQ